MSKKNKNKFKRQIKAQMRQEMNQARIQTQQPVGAKKDKMTVTAPVVAVSSNDTIALNPEFNLPQIKRDLKKTAVVVLILAGVIVALYFLDSKYNILLPFGNWLFRILNIQQ